MASASYRTTALAVVSGLSLAILASLSMPALAMPNDGGGGSKMDDLKKQGFTCERAGVNFIVCSKPGEKDWYCTDAGDCQQVPFKRNPATIFHAPVNRGLLTH